MIRKIKRLVWALVGIFSKHAPEETDNLVFDEAVGEWVETT